MLVIRLARMGAKKKPYFRVVVIEQSRPRDGRFVEIVGHYNPRKNPADFQMNSERVHYWLQQGAQPSDTVKSFIRRFKTSQQASQAQPA